VNHVSAVCYWHTVVICPQTDDLLARRGNVARNGRGSSSDGNADANCDAMPDRRAAGRLGPGAEFDSLRHRGSRTKKDCFSLQIRNKQKWAVGDL